MKRAAHHEPLEPDLLNTLPPELVTLIAKQVPVDDEEDRAYVLFRDALALSLTCRRQRAHFMQSRVEGDTLAALWCALDALVRANAQLHDEHEWALERLLSVSALNARYAAAAWDALSEASQRRLDNCVRALPRRWLAERMQDRSELAGRPLLVVHASEMEPVATGPFRPTLKRVDALLATDNMPQLRAVEPVVRMRLLWGMAALYPYRRLGRIKARTAQGHSELDRLFLYHGELYARPPHKHQGWYVRVATGRERGRFGDAEGPSSELGACFLDVRLLRRLTDELTQWPRAPTSAGVPESSPAPPMLVDCKHFEGIRRTGDDNQHVWSRHLVYERLQASRRFQDAAMQCLRAMAQAAEARPPPLRFLRGRRARLTMVESSSSSSDEEDSHVGGVSEEAPSTSDDEG